MSNRNVQSSKDEKDDAFIHEELPEKGGDDQQLPAADYSGVRKKTDPKEIALVRKLDFVMMPILWFMYFLNYLDRNAITVARLDDMEEDLGLVGNQYLTAVSILFVGYILGQVPATMAMTRVRPSLFMASWMAIWAVVSGCTGLVQNYTGLVVTRFFLGVSEAPFYPGALFMISQFYTKKEIATRLSILYTANICGTAFAGLIAIGVFKMDGLAGLEGWRWLFILLGIITLFVSFASAFLLPDEPLNTRWLTPEQRQLAHDRMAADTVERKGNTATFAGLKEAVRDYRLWVLIAMYHFHMAASNFKNFFPTIVQTLGFDRNTTLALTCPPYIVSGIITIGWGYSSGRFNERTWHITVSKVIAVFGFILACATLNVGARYFAMCAFATGVYACNSVIIGWISSTCGQTKEKKAAAIGLANTIANLSPIYSPYLWPAWNEPRYYIPMAASAAFSFVALVLAWVMRRILVVENRRIRASDTESTLLYPY